MATSGEILGNNVSVSGVHVARMRIEWQLASQNVGGNFSTINWQAYTDFFGCDAQLDAASVNTNIGTVYNNGGRVYNYAGNFSNHTVTMATGSFNIGADGAGNTTLQMNGQVAVYQSGESTCGTSTWTLPTIPRYAVIDGFNINFTTDAEIEFAWHADRSCDYISWWSGAYDGGGHHDQYVGGGQGWWTQDLLSLRSDTTYDITVAVRNAASGLWTTSGTQNPTTGHQNNLFKGRVL